LTQITKHSLLAAQPWQQFVVQVFVTTSFMPLPMVEVLDKIFKLEALEQQLYAWS